MVPGSLQAALNGGSRLPAAEQEGIDGLSCRTELPSRLRELGVQAVIDRDPAGVEVEMDVGDMLILVRVACHPCFGALAMQQAASMTCARAGSHDDAQREPLPRR